MATRDDETLIRLRKALENRAATDFVREAWQEHLSRVAQIQSSEVVSGLAGSWAGSLERSFQATQEPDSSNADKSGSTATAFPHDVQTIDSRLGLAGHPEINFRPYDHGSHRFGPKGPSLLGHPIAFHVIGPTKASPFCDWQWTVGSVGNNDTLTMADGPSGSRSAADLAEAYNLSGTGISAYNGGLYLVISDTGSVDGTLAAGVNGLTPLSKYVGSARFEIFRVSSYTGGVITLASEKRLSSVFTIPLNPALRSIMLFQPQVTRLVGMPGSGPAVGRERIFVVVPPENTASSGFYPPYKVWEDGGFEATSTAGEVASYGGQAATPIPVARRTMQGVVEYGGGTPADGPGIWRIQDIAGSPVVAGDAGKVVRVTGVNLVDGAALSHGDEAALLGYYEIVDASAADEYQLKRLPEVDPATGRYFFGPGPYFDTTGHTGAAKVEVTFTLHDAISELFTGDFDLDRVEAARLGNLIDPEWVRRTTKIDASGKVPSGGSPGRADRSIFDTESGTGQADPGSLLDLGFRMVLFPAKDDGGGDAVPDFSRPIYTRDVVIDPSVTTDSQFIEVDYAGGLVYLSHAPPASSGGAIVPAGIIGSGGNNPRGEVVLFAACVPYSRESGQTGVGLRVTGGDLESATLGYSSATQRDVFGGRVHATLTAHAAGSNPHTMTLTGTNSANWPETGSAEVLYEGGSPLGLSQGRIFWTGLGNVTGTTFDLTGVATDAAIPFTVPATVVLRKGDGDLRLDTTYGAKWRSGTWRIAYGDLTAQPDGSLLITPTAVQGPAAELRAGFPLGGSSEVARLFLDTKSNRWTTTAPSWASDSEDNEVGLEVARGRLYASLSLDFAAGTLSSTRFLNRVEQVSSVNATIPDSASPPNQFDLVVDEASSVFQTALPTNVAGLCAVVEGSTIASAENASWTPLVAGVRLVVDAKIFGRAGGKLITAREYAEAPANPLNWFAYTAVGSDSPTDIQTAINSHYSGLTPASSPSTTEGSGATERLLVSGRQVRVLPAQYYLESQVINALNPFTTSVASGFALSVFSADPKNDNGSKWATLVLNYDTTITSTDPDEVAAFLNQALYETTYAGYVGDKLDDAGFYETPAGVSASPNAWIGGAAAGSIAAPTGAPVGERQFLFIGPGDARHPTGSETVCLICGGWGSGDASASAQDFYNVMIEVGRVNAEDSSGDIAGLLAGDFDPDPYEIPTCGLFFGDDANDTPSPPVAGDFPSEAAANSGATDLGFSQNGVRPLGHLVGSHRVKSTASSPLRARIEILRGHGSDWFAGPRRAPVFQVGTDLEPGSTPAQAWPDKGYEYGYMGRWVWGAEDLTVIDRTTGSAAGLADIWVSYGLSPHGEMGFSCLLTATSQVGYPSFLIEVTATGTEFDSPSVAPNSIAAGDLVTGIRDGTTEAFEGRVLAWDTSTNTGELLVVSRGTYETTDGHLLPQGFQPTSIGAFSPTANTASTDLEVSIIPRPGFNQFASAFRSLAKHANTVLTNTSDEYGQGLDGGSADTTATSSFSGVLVGGGRVDLISLIGPSALPGVSFTTPVVGEGLAASPLQVTTTFLESGVFSTSVALGNLDWPAPDSGGVYDQGLATGESTSESLQRLPKGSYAGGAHVGGVAGLRVSGDAQIWLTNPRPLASTQATAYVRRMLAVKGSVGWNLMEVGPAATGGYDNGMAHAISGFGAARRAGSAAETMFIQEATVSLGLTRADLHAFLMASGQLDWPGTQDDLIRGADAIGALRAAWWVGNPDMPVLMPFLEGKYLQLEDTSGGYTSDNNNGVWRIVGAPVITMSGLSAELESKFPALTSLATGQTGSTANIRDMEDGTLPASAVVSVLQLRVERYAVPPANDANVAATLESFVPESVRANQLQGHPWGIYADIQATEKVYVADVVDPGGSPTGAPQGIHGMSLDPSWLGREDLPMEMIPVFRDGPGTDRWPLPGAARLLGIRSSEDSRGRVTSHAWFSWSGTPGTTTTHHVYARAVVHATARADGLDDLSSASTWGEFAMDRAGRVSFVGHTQRLGPGVLLDGGLGLVMASAFRATPRPVEMETLAGFSVVGQASAWPLTSHFRSRSHGAPSVPSTFNTVEFFEDATVVGPHGSLQFEDARAAQGLPFRLKENAVAASSFASPARLLIARTSPDLGGTDEPNIHITPNDSLFPAPWSGIRFRSPGTVRYERPFRVIDAKGGHQGMNALLGAPSSGIRGIEVPTFGECLLLPKGPPTMAGSGWADFVTDTAVGSTPTDTPLYEFRANKTTDFGISPEMCFSSAERTKDGDRTEGPASHEAGPGVLSQAYRHSRSRSVTGDYPNSGTAEQMRILDGMVIEDVSNGCFFTAGHLGREFAYTNVNTLSGELGNGTRGPINGSITINHGGVTNELQVVYDIGPYVDVSEDPEADTVNGTSNGFGDRIDTVTVVVAASDQEIEQVRRPLVGHRYRITPNVEFVPVLGPRGVGGGLIPPWTDATDPTTSIDSADAIFYSTRYSFKPPGGDFGAGDVGRMIYICGTYNYKYTGWWVVIDVLDNYEVQPAIVNEFDGTGANAALTTSVAVVRKLRREGDAKKHSTTFDGALPLVARAPLLEAASNFRTNQSLMSGTPGDFGNMSLWITDNTGASFYTAGPTILAPGSADPDGIVTLLNSTAAFNGLSTSFGVQFIVWSSNGASLEVTYDLSLLTATQAAQVTGNRAALRVEWLSTSTGHTMPTAGNARDPMSIGFHSYPGHASQLDRGFGDRNNALPIVDNSQHFSRSAAAGLRWVFSAPLTEEHSGSYVHLKRPAKYRFNTLLASQSEAGASLTTKAWVGGNPYPGDDIDEQVDIFRINRCPTTADLILGGDCEEYYTELIKVGRVVSGTNGDSGRGRPLLYSPLGVYGFWPDTVSGEIPSRGHNYVMQYAIQPVARERIVTISPNNMKSSTWVVPGATTSGDVDVGTGPKVMTNTTSGLGFDLSTPWVLMDRSMVSGRTGTLLWNADTGRNYVWTPGPAWWQLWVPSPDNQRDAEEPMPTLRVDLTDAFTQAMQPGGGIASPFPGKQPKGARLLRLWVNFGVWGNNLPSRGEEATPGYVDTSGDPLAPYYMAFNLIVELPGSHAREFKSGISLEEHPYASGPGISPFGGRAPTVMYNHDDNTGTHKAGGAVVVPLYVNREAGDIMPNVMERWVDAGPSNTPGAESDWRTGDPEYGFGCSSESSANDLHGSISYLGNAHNPIVWGSQDFTASVWGARDDSLVLASPLPRSSLTSGGIRSAFTSGLWPDMDDFSGTTPPAVCPQALTGIVVAHGGENPKAPDINAGSAINNVPTTCPHAFTIALTPVGDDFDATDSASIQKFGRRLTPGSFRPKDRPFKVGNWLDYILERYGIAAPSGSMLPPGARVYLEITAGNGDVTNSTGAGCWVGSVKAAFEVETADGTAYVENVNHLGNDR